MAMARPLHYRHGRRLRSNLERAAAGGLSQSCHVRLPHGPRERSHRGQGEHELLYGGHGEHRAHLE